MFEALVIIDVQNDYFPGGRMEVVNSEKATKAAKLLLDEFRKNNKLVVHIQHISQREGAGFFLPETEGVKIHDSMTPLDGEKVIIKHFPNSFRDTDLEDYLHNNEIKKIIFCGMMTHMCIDATVRAAFDKGFACIVADDACATRDLSHGGINIKSTNVHASYMAALDAVYANVVTANEIIGK